MTNQQIDLGAAGVPQDAIKRLAELQPGKAGSIFTSPGLGLRLGPPR